MNRRLPLLTLSTAGLVALSITCATPSLAAAPSAPTPAPQSAAGAQSAAQPGLRALATPRVDSVTISGGADGDFGRRVAIDLSGATPGAFYEATNETNGDSIDYDEVNGLGRFGVQLVITPGVKNDVLVTLTDPDDFSNTVEVRIDVDDTRPELVAPTVVTTEEAGRTVITGTGIPGAFLHVKDVQGHLIAVEKMVGGTARIALPASSNETRYQVSQYDKLVSSPSAEVVVNEGSGASVPAAPEAEVVSANGKMVARASGEPGSTLTLRDKDGRVVGLRVMNATGRAEVVLPSLGTETSIEATVARGQVVSDSVDVELPAR